MQQARNVIFGKSGTWAVQPSGDKVQSTGNSGTSFWYSYAKIQVSPPRLKLRRLLGNQMAGVNTASPTAVVSPGLETMWGRLDCTTVVSPAFRRVVLDSTSTSSCPCSSSRISSLDGSPAGRRPCSGFQLKAYDQRLRYKISVGHGRKQMIPYIGIGLGEDQHIRLTGCQAGAALTSHKQIGGDVQSGAEFAQGGQGRVGEIALDLGDIPMDKPVCSASSLRVIPRFFRIFRTCSPSIRPPAFSQKNYLQYITKCPVRK
mgnify:CR=1 FL=1